MPEMEAQEMFDLLMACQDTFYHFPRTSAPIFPGSHQKKNYIIKSPHQFSRGGDLCNRDSSNLLRLTAGISPPQQRAPQHAHKTGICSTQFYQFKYGMDPSLKPTATNRREDWYLGRRITKPSPSPTPDGNEKGLGGCPPPTPHPR